MLGSRYYLDAGPSTRADGEHSVRIAPPPSVSLAMSQHVGLPAVVCVVPGQRVAAGEKVGEAAPNGLSLPVHSPICGTVTEVARRINPRGRSDVFVTVSNDFGSDSVPAVPYGGDPEDLLALCAFLKDMGLVGMGGSGYPVYAKLKNAGQNTKRLIINATECEPFCSSTARIIAEHPDEVLRGAAILKTVLKPDEVRLVIEKRHRKLGMKLCELSRGLLEPAIVTDRYPIGDERQIVRALYKKELSGDALPSAVGCAIFNAATCAAVSRAVDRGLPLTHRIVTVNGDCVTRKKNLILPLGVDIREAVKNCGGFVTKPYMLVLGGPMLGYSVDSPQAAVTKPTTAILAFRERFRSGNEDCIHCGRCVKICPMGLMPFYFERAVRSKLPLGAGRNFDPSLCSECGLCTYICPANVPLNYLIKIAKKKEAL